MTGMSQWPNCLGKKAVAGLSNEQQRPSNVHTWNGDEQLHKLMRMLVAMGDPQNTCMEWDSISCRVVEK